MEQKYRIDAINDIFVLKKNIHILLHWISFFYYFFSFKTYCSFYDFDKFSSKRNINLNDDEKTL